VKKITRKSFQVESAKETRKGEYAKMIASIEKAKSVLKWVPKRTIDESVNSLVKWYSDKPKGWER
jgi:UDP-glucose 4-epimerase